MHWDKVDRGPKGRFGGGTAHCQEGKRRGDPQRAKRLPDRRGFTSEQTRITHTHTLTQTKCYFQAASGSHAELLVA